MRSVKCANAELRMSMSICTNRKLRMSNCECKSQFLRKSQKGINNVHELSPLFSVYYILGNQSGAANHIQNAEVGVMQYLYSIKTSALAANLSSLKKNTRLNHEQFNILECPIINKVEN